MALYPPAGMYCNPAEKTGYFFSISVRIIFILTGLHGLTTVSPLSMFIATLLAKGPMWVC